MDPYEAPRSATRNDGAGLDVGDVIGSAVSGAVRNFPAALVVLSIPTVAYLASICTLMGWIAAEARRAPGREPWTG